MSERRLVLLDTNLLVLYVVGTASRAFIARHKRLSGFDENQYDLLVHLLAKYDGILLTPNTVTETSNLALQIAEPARHTIARVIQRMVQACAEIYVSSRRAVDAPSYQWMGITDSVLLGVDEQDVLILAADLNLFIEAHRQGKKALNFHHLR